MAAVVAAVSKNPAQKNSYLNLTTLIEKVVAEHTNKDNRLAVSPDAQQRLLKYFINPKTREIGLLFFLVSFCNPYQYVYVYSVLSNSRTSQFRSELS